MLHSFLASPFDDAARAEQFAAVRAALQADATTDTLLFGNLVLEDGATPIDALLVRPHSLTVVVLLPRGGRLSIPSLGYGGWQLAGAPLTGADEFDNPFEQVVQQKKAVEVWLRPRFSPEQVNLRFLTGLVLFGKPVEFAPDVEAALNSPTAAGFQLLSDPADLPRRLRQLATPEIDLSANDLADWAAEWADPVPAPARPALASSASAPPAPLASDFPAGPDGFLHQKARALWGWLGADDVPNDDTAYGADPGGVAARNEEKQHLEHLRQQLQADVNSQLQAMQAREAERERSIAQLRAELAQAPPVAAEATALVSRLSAETREKAALEAAMQASRAESEARNQELDAKIQQLGQLIERLNAAPAAPVASAAPTPDAPTTAAFVSPAPITSASAVSASTSTPIAPAFAAPAPVASALVAAVPPAFVAPSPIALAAGAAPPAAKPTYQDFQEKLGKLKAAAEPRFRQALAWGRQQPRVALAAGVVVVASLVGWGFHHADSGSLVPYQENGRWGFADAKGQPVIPAQFTAASPFQAGQAVVAKDGAYGTVNEEGKEVIAPAYDALNPFAGGYARARLGDAYTFIDEKGEEFDHYYFNALDFAEGRAAVLDHRGWHYITGPEEPAQPVVFIEAYSFVDGLARVKLADGFTYVTPGYLDDSGAGTKPFGRYEQAADFADGKARVTQQGRVFLIDKDGEEVK